MQDLKKKKKILLICPYDNIYPPMNGGMQRCFNVLHQLTIHFELTAIINQDKKEFLKSVDSFPAIASATILSVKDFNTKDIFSILPSKFEKAFRYRWYRKQIFGSADDNYLLYYPILKDLFKKQKFDIVILESLATLNAISLIRKYDRFVKIIYDAHNVDTNLAETSLVNNEISPERLREVYETETTLYKRVNAVFSCSLNDKEEFKILNKGELLIEVVPNGVNVPDKKYNKAVNEEIPQFLIFCGSLWSMPNAEGLHWFCNKIWPKILYEYPNLKLLIIGSGELPEKYIDICQMKNIEFIGAVDDVKEWYNKAAISVVPLLTGSGTRLKILEAMGMGVPVVSTTIGAEGINYSNNEDIVIADKVDEFVERVLILLNDKKKRLALQENAFRLVEKNYDWDYIGKTLAKFLNSN